MHRLNIKIDDLFKIMNKHENTETETFKPPFQIKVKNHENDFVPINEFHTIKTDSYVSNFSNGSELITSDEHILLTDRGEKKIKDINESTPITLTTGEVVYKENTILKKQNDLLFDFGIDSPHLYQDSCGFVHHNSAVQYVISQFIRFSEMKTLIIVPTISLVDQLFGDFMDYGIDDPYNNVHRIMSGKAKHFDAPITISTYQSIAKQEPEFFAGIDCIIVDECLSGDTLIETPTGRTQIKDLKSGDKVYSYSEETKTKEIDEVVKVHENLEKSNSEDMYEFEMDTGEIIQITGNHEVYTTEGKIQAKYLTENQEIISFYE